MTQHYSTRQDLIRVQDQYQGAPYLMAISSKLLASGEDPWETGTWVDHLIPMPRGYFQGQIPEDDFMQGVIQYFLHAGFERFNRLGRIEGFLLFPHPDAGLESVRSFGPSGEYQPKIPEIWIDHLAVILSNKKKYNFQSYM
jgi:hypothetical protein